MMAEYYVVAQVQPFGSVKVRGPTGQHPLASPKDAPHCIGVMMVFDDYDAAVKWAGPYVEVMRFTSSTEPGGDGA
jgi:hypothetical protein